MPIEKLAKVGVDEANCSKLVTTSVVEPPSKQYTSKLKCLLLPKSLRAKKAKSTTTSTSDGVLESKHTENRIPNTATAVVVQKKVPNRKDNNNNVPNQTNTKASTYTSADNDDIDNETMEDDVDEGLVLNCDKVVSGQLDKISNLITTTTTASTPIINEDDEDDERHEFELTRIDPPSQFRSNLDVAPDSYCHCSYDDGVPSSADQNDYNQLTTIDAYCHYHLMAPMYVDCASSSCSSSVPFGGVTGTGSTSVDVVDRKVGNSSAVNGDPPLHNSLTTIDAFDVTASTGHFTPPISATLDPLLHSHRTAVSSYSNNSELDYNLHSTSLLLQSPLPSSTALTNSALYSFYHYPHVRHPNYSTVIDTAQSASLQSALTSGYHQVKRGGSSGEGHARQSLAGTSLQQIASIDYYGTDYLADQAKSAAADGLASRDQSFGSTVFYYPSPPPPPSTPQIWCSSEVAPSQDCCAAASIANGTHYGRSSERAPHHHHHHHYHQQLQNTSPYMSNRRHKHASANSSHSASEQSNVSGRVYTPPLGLGSLGLKASDDQRISGNHSNHLKQQHHHHRHHETPMAHQYRTSDVGVTQFVSPSIQLPYDTNTSGVRATSAGEQQFQANQCCTTTVTAAGASVANKSNNHFDFHFGDCQQNGQNRGGGGGGGQCGSVCTNGAIHGTGPHNSTATTATAAATSTTNKNKTTAQHRTNCSTVPLSVNKYGEPVVPVHQSDRRMAFMFAGGGGGSAYTSTSTGHHSLAVNKSSMFEQDREMNIAYEQAKKEAQLRELKGYEAGAKYQPPLTTGTTGANSQVNKLGNGDCHPMQMLLTTEGGTLLPGANKRSCSQWRMTLFVFYWIIWIVFLIGVVIIVAANARHE